MLALTLHAAWPWAIVHLNKRVENRSLRLSEQVVRQVGDGWLAIHAGKNLGERPGLPATKAVMEGLHYMAEREGWRVLLADSYTDDIGRIYPYPAAVFRRGYGRSITEHMLCADKVTTSAVVAIARVNGVLQPGKVAPWKVTKSAAVRLGEVKVLSEPLPMGGRQGLWSLTAAQTETVLVRAGVS